MISIIIPTLNEEKNLPLLLASIKKQDYTDYEIIVADARSADATRHIAQQAGCLIVDGGMPSAGRNRGAEVAHGDVLLFLDADVILPPRFLSRSMAEFTRRNLGIAGFALQLLDEGGIDKIIRKLFNAVVALTAAFMPRAYVVIMARRDVHQTIGGFDESVLFLEDFCYARSAAKVARHGYIPVAFFTSDRRYKKDGRIIYVKYMLGELYTILIGPIRSDIFHYKFNHYKEKNNV